MGTLFEAVLKDGAMVVAGFDLIYDPSAVEVWRDSMRLLMMKGSDPEPLPFFLWYELYRSPGSFGRVRFGAASLPTFHRAEVRESDGTHGRLHYRALDGRTERIARWPVSGRAFEPSEMLEASRADGATEEELRAETRRLEEQSFRYPDSIPAYDAHLVDSEGVSWLRRFRYPWEEDNDPVARWDLISEDGRWLGWLDLPGPFEPMDIGADELVGVFETELGEEEVRVYRLERGESG